MKKIDFSNAAHESLAEITEWMNDNGIASQKATADEPQPDYWLVSDADADRIEDQFPFADLYYFDYEI